MSLPTFSTSRKQAAGGDGTGERKAETNGESETSQENRPLRRGRGFPSSVTFGDSFPLGKLIARVRAPAPVIDPRELLYSRQFELVILLHIILYLLRKYSALPFLPAPSRIGIAVFVTFPRKIEAVFVQNG